MQLPYKLIGCQSQFKKTCQSIIAKSVLLCQLAPQQSISVLTLLAFSFCLQPTQMSCYTDHQSYVLWSLARPVRVLLRFCCKPWCYLLALTLSICLAPSNRYVAPLQVNYKSSLEPLWRYYWPSILEFDIWSQLSLAKKKASWVYNHFIFTTVSFEVAKVF